MIGFAELKVVIYVTAALTLFNMIFKIRAMIANKVSEDKEEKVEEDPEKRTMFKNIVDIFKMLLLILLFSPLNEELYFEGTDQIMIFILAIDQVIYVADAAKKEYVTEEGSNFGKILETNAELFEFGNRLFLCLYLLYIGWWVNGPVEITNMKYPLLLSSLIFSYHNIVDMLSN